MRSIQREHRIKERDLEKIARHISILMSHRGNGLIGVQL